jgi:protein SCO1/2
MHARRSLISMLGTALAATTVLGPLAACDSGHGAGAGTAFKGVDITGADYAKALGLPDVDGHVRQLVDFQGKVLVVFFGYVQCPDVCPTTLTELAAIKQQLGVDGARVQALFVTVDPERDTPEVLKSYMGSFGPDFVALRGTPEQTLALAKSFKVFYAKVPGKTEGSYTVDHTAGSYLFDPQGRVRVFSRYGTPPEDLLRDVKALLASSS